jgi:threonine/homoserine/homoserine lactone efflux protein
MCRRRAPDRHDARVHAFALGVVAGLAVAIPLGPVGALLVGTGLTHPRRVAFAAAAGVATVDLVYAVLAVLVGDRVAAVLGPHETAVRRLAGFVLLAIGLVTLVGAWRRASAPPEDGPVVVATTPLRAYGRFVALTAVNPLTALTFATVAVGLVARLGAATAVVAVLFPLGVGLASLAWQSVLAGAGSLVGARLGPRARAWTGVASAALVVVLAVVVLYS